MVGITPAIIQLFAFAGLSGFLLFTFWRFFILGAIAIFIFFSFADTSPKKNDVTVETVIENILPAPENVLIETLIAKGSITPEGVRIPPAPKEYIDDCMVHLKISEAMCIQNWNE